MQAVARRASGWLRRGSGTSGRSEGAGSGGQDRVRRAVSFALADGSKITRQVSECRFSLVGEEAHSPVVLGEPGDAAVLGAVTLETLGLVLSPFDRTLRPMRMLMV